MAVFRVEKNKGYTVMSNHHLRNKELSLKAKGLLSQMLSLPEDWDYTLAGLSLINREKIDAIREAVRELENAGYIQRSRERDEKGCLRGTTYVIYEQPPKLDLPTLEKPTLDNPTLDNPTLEKPMLEKPTLENPTQLNKELLKTNLPTKEKLNTDISSTHSIPFHSLNPSPLEDAAQPPERKRKETTDAYSVYEEIIKDNIEYDYLIQDRYLDRDRIEEILALILETVCTKRRTIRIAGDDHPAELVKAKFMKLNSEHIRFVLDCMQENTTKIRNIKQYMKAALFNAPSTIGKQCAFQKFCKSVLHNEACNAHEEIRRRRVREVTFSNLALHEERQLYTVDKYFQDEEAEPSYQMAGKEITPKLLLEAIRALPEERRKIILLYYFEGLTDIEIGKQLNISRSTVQYRRTSSFEQLKKYLEENADEWIEW